MSRARNGSRVGRMAMALCLGTACAAALAQSQGTLEERLRTQLRALNAQNQQLQAERAALQASLHQAEEQKAAASQALAAAQGELDASRQHAQRLAARQRQVEEAAATQTRQAEARRDEQQQAARALQQQLAGTAAERGRATDALRERDAQLQACGAMNARLQEIGKEILAAYERFDVADAVAFRQPFAEKARVRLETQSQAYGDALHENRFDPRAVSAPPAPPVGTAGR